MEAVRPAVAPLRAIGLIVIGMFCFAIQDVMVKVVAADTSVWQMQFLRSLFVLAFAMPILLFFMGARLSFKQGLLWPLLRGLVMCGAYIFFYISLPLLSLSAATATFFVAPLLITLLSALVLRERLGWRRLTAVVIGFLGVVFIVRPGAAGWTPEALLPLGAALSYAAGVILTRWRCRSHTPVTLTLVHNLFYAAMGLLGVVVVTAIAPTAESAAAWPFLATGWWPVTGVLLGLIALTAATHTTGAMVTTRAYQEAEASELAPFEYAYLLPMPIIDVLLFDTQPHPATLVGMTLIAGAGIFIAWRERRPPAPVPAAARRLGGPKPRSFD